MARFQFPLERVLRWRAIELATEESKLQRIIRDRMAIQARVAELSAEKATIEHSPESLPDLCGADLKAMMSYRLRLQILAEDLGKRFFQCERELMEQRKKVRAAQQRLRLLEELRSRKRSEWEDLQDAEIEAMASESFLAQWSRNMAE